MAPAWTTEKLRGDERVAGHDDFVAGADAQGVKGTCSAAVPVATLMAYLLPCHSANCFSNSMPRLPVQ